MPQLDEAWKESVVYQIYPRSFKDSDGDGIGDLRGIIGKLDYLEMLGVDVVWLCPVYRSPGDDNGYDISDYRQIEPVFGTMEDWRELRDGLHARGMKLIMDLVVNHTSDEHEWFQASRRSAAGKYRDYYYWRPARYDGKEPNNWVSVFGGSAWSYDSTSGYYYLHLFSRRQPDLNWDNPSVRRDIYRMMRWWLDQGIDGFRMDVINYISKADGLPEAHASGGERYAWGGAFFTCGPKFHDYLMEMNREVLSRYPGLITVGEMPGVTVEQARLYTGDERCGMNMVFQFEHMEVDGGSDWFRTDWRIADLKGILHKWQTGLAGAGWNSLYLNNHDQPRMVSRFGDDREPYRIVSAKMLATLLHTLQGTPFIYQGEEIGMTNVRFPSIEDYRDVATRNAYRELVGERGVEHDRMMAGIHAKSRDNARTPVQWDDGSNGGFTNGSPWIGINPNYRSVNVKQALEDPDSILHYYRKLIRLRKNHPDVLVYGKYEVVEDWYAHIYCYTRTSESGERWLVLLNLSPVDSWMKLPDYLQHRERDVLLNNYEVLPEWDIMEVSLRPYEARVYRLR